MNASVAPPDEASARALVTAFIADFHAAWLRKGQVPMRAATEFDPTDPLGFRRIIHEEIDYDGWTRELSALVERYFVPGGQTGAEGSIGGPISHDPERERITAVRIGADTGDVASVHDGPSGTMYYTYRLVSAPDGWRIRKIVLTFDPPDEPLLTPDEIARLLAAVDSGEDAGAEDPEPLDDPSELFSGRYEIAALGSVTTSGVLTMHDFGWVGFDLAPFIRKVPAGTYPAELARCEDINLALRVRFADTPVASRIPASRVGTGHVVSVDAANVLVADFATLASCSHVTANDASDVILTTERFGAPVSLTAGEPDSVVAISGIGDGGYPASWGVAEDGQTVDLIVDFLAVGVLEPEHRTITGLLLDLDGVLLDPSGAAHAGASTLVDHALRAGLAVGVFATSDEPDQRRRLERAGLARPALRVLVVRAADGTRLGPEDFERACATLGTRPEQTAMIGDDLVGTVVPACMIGIAGLHLTQHPDPYIRHVGSLAEAQARLFPDGPAPSGS